MGVWYGAGVDIELPALKSKGQVFDSELGLALALVLTLPA